MTAEINTTEAPAAIVDLIQPIIDRYNQQVTDDDNAFYNENPDEERVPSDLYTLESVMSAFANGVDHRSHVSWLSIIDLVREFNEAVLVAINAHTAFDPWPDLTRRELKFLIGGRTPPANAGGLAWAAEDHLLNEPLTLTLKLLAHRHRGWLEKDIERRRTKLNKAKAIVLAMGGEAA
jgi:hypothetical protein